MKKSKIIAIILVVLAVVVIQVMFSRSSESPDADTQAATETQAQSESATAEPAAPSLNYDFFKGKTIEFIVPYSVGGGYDVYARLIAPYLQKYLEATVVVLNVPGGGSLLGTNQLFHAEPNGLTIGIMNGLGMTYLEITKEPNVDFNIREFSYLGRASAEGRYYCISSSQPDFKTWEDMYNLERPVSFAFTGKGSEDYYNAYMIFKVFGVELKAITGFAGMADCEIGVVRGDADMTSNNMTSILPKIRDGELVPVMQVGDPLEGDYKDVPHLKDLLPETVTQAQRDMVDAINSSYSLDRVVAAPPGVPADILATLQDAYRKVFEDQEFLDTMKKSERLAQYATAEEVAGFLEEVFEATNAMLPIIEESMK